MPTKHTIRGNTVLVDGEVVGTVEKIEHEGLWHGGYGIRAGGVEWKGTAPDGTEFGANERRKDAAAALVRYAEPLKVENLRIEDYCGRRFIAATVSWQGHTAIVSQYPGETYWVVDAYYTPGAFCPAWSNGAGTRYTKAHTLKAEQAAAVDAALAETDLASQV